MSERFPWECGDRARDHDVQDVESNPFSRYLSGCSATLRDDSQRSATMLGWLMVVLLGMVLFLAGAAVGLAAAYLSSPQGPVNASVADVGN